MTDAQLLNRLNRVEKFLGLVLTSEGTDADSMLTRLKHLRIKYKIIA